MKSILYHIDNGKKQELRGKFECITAQQCRMKQYDFRRISIRLPKIIISSSLFCIEIREILSM